MKYKKSFTPLEKVHPVRNNGHLRYPVSNGIRERSSLTGFTLVEIIIVTVILLMVTGVLFMVMNVGDISYSLNSEKIALYERARVALYWITRDVRQTTAAEILSDSNNPSSSHIKFRICSGFETDSPQLTSEYIEYTYDSNEQRLTRRDNNNNFTLTFGNITAAPFDITEPADSKLIVNIKMQNTVRGRPLTARLHSEIKIRNE